MKEATGKILGGLIVVVIVLAWAWPRGGWHNEWSQNGQQCLAWRVTEYAGGMFTSIEHGPHVVDQKWC